MQLSPAAVDKYVRIGKQGVPALRAELFMKGSIGPQEGWADAAVALRELKALTAGTVGAAALVREGERLIGVPAFRWPGAFERLGSALSAQPIRMTALHLESAQRVFKSDDVFAIVDGDIVVQ